MNIIYILTNYWSRLGKILTRPILFFYEAERESWDAASFAFLKVHSIILGFALALLIFLLKYYGIGMSLVKDLNTLQFFLTLPVLILLALVFFMITFFILSGAIFIMLILLALGLVALPYLFLKTLKKRINLASLMKVCFYSFAPFLSVSITLAHLLLVKYNFSDMKMLRLEENLIYYLTVLFFWGLLSIGFRREAKIPRGLAVWIALFPVLILIAANVVVDWKILPIIGELL